MATLVLPPPTPEPKPHGVTQAGRILRSLKVAGSKGVPNYKLAEYNLGYRARITELRQDGHDITCHRQYVNGRATGVWIYYLNDI